MKSYLDLVSISKGLHKKKNRMSVFCIVLSVFLVTIIFGMADMFIRSQILQAKKDGGNWHIAIQKITDEEAALISARPEIVAAPRYGVRNFRENEGYFLSGKDAIIMGCDEDFVTDIFDEIAEGRFPQSDMEAMLTKSAQGRLGLKIGDEFTLDTPDKAMSYTVCGFSENAMKTMDDDAYGIILTTDAFRALFSGEQSNELEDYDSVLYIQFNNHTNIQRIIEDIKEQFCLSDDQVIENTKLLGLTGQSRNDFMLQIYGVAGILFLLVMLAGILMIAGSLNSDVAQRTEFFGMMRCIGATPKQVMKMVKKEAMGWCRFAVPCGVLVGMCFIWLLCAVLRVLSPIYFGELPKLGVSLASILMGAIVGLLTVFFAARSPAKRASGVSPLTAVSGNASSITQVKRAANTRCFKIETALGVHHATADKKNFLLMVGSFGISIVLFLSFSVTVDFMNHGLTALRPSAPDISILCKDSTCSVEYELIERLKNHPAVRQMYGRMSAGDDPVTVEGSDGYRIIDLQLSQDAVDADVDEIYEIVGDDYTFSDQRMSNQSVRGAYYSFTICVYGFLILIAMITVLNIVNSIAMSVAARIRQYGVFRAIGFTHRQLVKMVVAEAASYALTGCMLGCVFGIGLNRLLFLKLISFYWGDPWRLPYGQMLIILSIVFFSTVLAVQKPLKCIQELSIVDTISAQ